MIAATTNPVAYARGVLQVEADTARRQNAKTLAALEFLTAAVTGGQRWEIDGALHQANLIIAAQKGEQL